MQRSIPFAEGEYYHVFNRGVEKRDIFLSDHDRSRFLKLLYLCNGTKPIEMRTVPEGEEFFYDRGNTLTHIGAYCLMTNHVHLLLKEKQTGGTSRFLQKLLTAYSMYFNKKYHRTGALFGGKSGSTHANNDQHLRHLYAYIHLNPISMIEPEWKLGKIIDAEKARKFLEQYPYSSYQSYLHTEVGPPYGGSDAARVILSKEFFPEYFESGADFEKMINDWIDQDELV